MKYGLPGLVLFIFIFAVAHAVSLTADYGRHLAKIVDDTVKTIHATESKSFITHADILALMCVEQRSLRIGNSSSVGARGLTQVMPNTFKDYYNRNKHGFRDFVNRTNCSIQALSQDPRCSIEAGARVFDDLLVRYNGDRNKAAGAYHGGPGAVISKTQYKGPKTTKYANEWFPACFNKIKSGQAPESTEVWKALVSEVVRITGGTFGAYGIVPQLVQYTAGSDRYVYNVMTQNPTATNPIFGSLISTSYPGELWSSFKNWFKGESNNEIVERQNETNSYVNNLQEYNNQIQSADDFFGTAQSGLQTEVQKAGDLNSKDSFNANGGFLHCLPNQVLSREPFLLAYSCPKNYTFSSADFGANSDSGVKIYSLTESKTMQYSCSSDKKTINYKCSVTVVDPQILSFSVVGKEGSVVQVKWETKDFDNCKLLTESMQTLREGVSGSVFVDTDTLQSSSLQLICDSKSRIQVKKSISI